MRAAAMTTRAAWQKTADQSRALPAMQSACAPSSERACGSQRQRETSAEEARANRGNPERTASAERPHSTAANSKRTPTCREQKVPARFPPGSHQSPEADAAWRTDIPASGRQSKEWIEKK